MRQALSESLGLSWRMRHRFGVVQCLEICAGIAHATGRPQDALALLRAGDAVRTGTGIRLTASVDRWHRSLVSSLKRELGRDPFEAAWSERSRSGFEEAVQLVEKMLA